MKSLLLSICYLSLLLNTGLASAGIIINEIMRDPAGVSDSRGEWFELYNSDLFSVDLAGWTIADLDGQQHQISRALIIGPQDYLVLGRNSDASLNGGLTLDYSYGGSITLVNGVDELLIKNLADEIIDVVEYSAALAFPAAAGRSIALLDPLFDNNLGANWVLTDNSLANGYHPLNFGTPGRENFPSVMASVPAPSTGVLMIMGLAGLIGTARLSGSTGVAGWRGPAVTQFARD